MEWLHAGEEGYLCVTLGRGWQCCQLGEFLVSSEHLQQKIRLVQDSVFPPGKGTKIPEEELRDVFTSIGKLHDLHCLERVK